jgi:tetratricopeptide (TPR) repeat protein
MTNVSSSELISAGLEGKRQLHLSTAERISSFSGLDEKRLACLSIFYTSLSPDGLLNFFSICGLTLAEDEMENWIETGLRGGVLKLSEDENQPDLFFICVQEDIQKALLSKCSADDLHAFHQYADRYFEAQFREMASNLNIDLPKNEVPETENALIRKWIIDPEGFISILSHLPQYRSLHISTVGTALNWQEHIFQLGNYKEAADLTNAFCFSLARQGRRREAENILARIANVTQDSTRRIALVNLAILLREEGQNAPALKIFKGQIPGLVVNKEYRNLVVALSEMSVVYRTQGKLLRAAILLECCDMLHGWLGNRQSQAIAKSQLANTYRQMRLFLPAKLSSLAAVNYFRKTNDLLNLGRSLLTQGNICIFSINRGGGSFFAGYARKKLPFPRFIEKIPIFFTISHSASRPCAVMTNLCPLANRLVIHNRLPVH